MAMKLQKKIKLSKTQKKFIRERIRECMEQMRKESHTKLYGELFGLGDNNGSES